MASACGQDGLPVKVFMHQASHNQPTMILSYIIVTVTVGASKTIAQRTRVCVEHNSTWFLFAAEIMLLLHLPTRSSELRIELQTG